MNKRIKKKRSKLQIKRTMCKFIKLSDKCKRDLRDTGFIPVIRTIDIVLDGYPRWVGGVDE